MLQNRFKKILVPLDGSLNSVRAMNEAISLARQCEATITGIHVLPVFPRKLVGTFNTYRNNLTKKAKKFMSQARTSAALHGIDFEEKIAVSNDIVKTITGYAKSYRFDVVVMGSRGQSISRAEFLGSVSNGVVHTSHIPVLIVK